MFTVLIAEKKYIDAIRLDNKLFFEPYLSKKDYGFCEWKPEGRTLEESVPDLPNVVARKKDWRAVIIHSATPDQFTKQNPFDLVDNSSVEECLKPEEKPEEKASWADWINSWKKYYQDITPLKEKMFRNAFEFPLQRLATWLCFKPADFVLQDVSEKQDAVDWAIEQIEKDERDKDREFVKQNAELEKLELAQSRLELRMKENLRREFVNSRSINICYPAEICCISERVTEYGFFNPGAYWNDHSTFDYSSFVDRNMYFDKMRFMVFDIFPETHREFKTDKLRFLNAIMIFITNPLPSSAMQPRRLYVLESENDETSLYTLITSFDKKLQATSEEIDGEIEIIKSQMPGELTDREVETLLCTPEFVPVTLDQSCNPDDLFAGDQYGLADRCPDDEFGVWSSEVRRAKKELAYIVKQQERSLRKSITKLNLQSEVNGKDISRLTSFQTDDVREFTENAEDEMVKGLPPDFSKLSEFSEAVSEKEAGVKRVLERRMTKKMTIILGAVCLVLFLLSLVPMIVGNIGVNAITVNTAMIFIGSFLGVMGVIMFVSLFFLRLPLKEAVRDFNEQMRETLNTILDGMKRHAKFLSSVCNVRRGHTIIQYTEKNVDDYTKSIRIRKKHQEDLRKKRAYLIESYGDFVLDETYCDETMSNPYDYDFGKKVEYEYPAPFLAGNFRQIEFLMHGNYIAVPSSFVTSLLLRVEEIYD